MLDNKTALIIGIFLLLLFSIAYAHEAEEETHEESTINAHSLVSSSFKYMIIASVISLLFIIISLYIREKSEKVKWILFLAIIIPVIASTAYLAYSTVYLNLVSETQGPVHWHADYEVWVCDEKAELVKPKGISNRIGSPLFHDHGDSRIHVEGVVADTRNVDLHSFFQTVGGDLDADILEIPKENEVVKVKNGDLCNGEEAKLQAFVYKVINADNAKSWIFEQEKIGNFPKYILSPYSNVPPGDCIIIEFGPESEKTGHICATYEAAMQRGELVGS
ncbi:hypothetical protein HYU50_01965 [Candidatus Woesearchaeota archaeon]|nr:hypothetical protein [Candidatus Woesearchaeota archaeon]